MYNQHHNHQSLLLLILTFYFNFPTDFLISSPLWSDAYCQYITPACQLYYYFAFITQLPKSSWLTRPVLAASCCVAGFPTTIFYGAIFGMLSARLLLFLLTLLYCLTNLCQLRLDYFLGQIFRVFLRIILGHSLELSGIQ